MTQDIFNRLCARIYAAFGKTAPAENTTIQTYLFDRVGWIEDDYAPKIAEIIEQLERMPANIGTEILKVYYSLGDVRKTERQPCDKCHNNGGWVWFVHPTYSAPNGYSVRCPFCNGGSMKEFNEQIEAGAKQVPSRQASRIYWEHCFGQFNLEVKND